ncbi:MAG: hypothetical protein K0S70_103 [Microbacterium sp.]|jgi:hypothetical protein|nr:hypothetical protein [Microbacterium sp.]
MNLFIWAGGEPIDLAKVKAAKAELDDGITEVPTVRPVNCGALGAQGLTFDDRVLAIGSAPPFLCDFFLVGEEAGPEEFTRALAWVLNIVEHDDRANAMGDTLKAVFGPGTREVPQEEIDAKRRLHEYQRNLA